MRFVHCPLCEETGTVAWLHWHLRRDHQQAPDEAYEMAGSAEVVDEEKEQPF